MGRARQRCAWMASTAWRGVAPRPTSGWLVATTNRNPACLSRAQASETPGRISNSSRPDGGYGLPSFTSALLITPSRSRNTARRNDGAGLPPVDGVEERLSSVGKLFRSFPLGAVDLEFRMGNEEM